MAGTIDKRDLELILEINKKSIELETEVANQNEEVIGLINNSITTNAANQKDLIGKLQVIENENKNILEKITDINDEIKEKTRDIVDSVKEIEENVNTTSQASSKDIGSKIIKELSDVKSSLETKISELQTKFTEAQKESKETNKDIFQLKILLASGVLTLIIQLIQAFTKK